MTKDKLIVAIIGDMDRVWGGNGFDGKYEGYQWLLENYGISEEEDVQWQLVLEYDANELSSEDQEDQTLMQFLEDDQAVLDFLGQFLQKYRSNTVSYRP